jgi:hypothetical protein
VRQRLLGPALAALALTSSRGDAQGRPGAADTPRGGGAVTLSQQIQPGIRPVPRQIRTEIAVLRATRLAGPIPPADSFIVGGRRVAPGETVGGTIAVARGSIEIYGRVDGDAVALHGDILVHEGGVVRGDAVAIGGRVRARGGVVEGHIRSASGVFAGLGRSRTADVASPGATWRAIKVVLGWFAVLLMLGIGVLVFAEPSLEPIIGALRARFGRAFWYGVLAQLGAVPLLLLIVLALAVTVVGILLVPFAIVAYAVALAGLVALGFLAVVLFTGSAVTGGARGRSAGPVRGASLRALVAGLTLYLGLWLAAAAFTWSPLAGSILRAVALAVTWVAVTLGLGAFVSSRVVLRRADATPGAAASDPIVWQTPTPITGVAAARRPVAVASSER